MCVCMCLCMVCMLEHMKEYMNMVWNQKNGCGDESNGQKSEQAQGGGDGESSFCNLYQQNINCSEVRND